MYTFKITPNQNSSSRSKRTQETEPSTKEAAAAHQPEEKDFHHIFSVALEKPSSQQNSTKF